MAELVQDNWILLVIALIVALLVAWWIFAATRRTRVDLQPSDDAEAGPARRNQALIDAPPAAAAGTIPPAAPVGLGGIEEAVAAITTAPPVSELEPSPLPLAPLPVDPEPLNPSPLDPAPLEPSPLDPAPLEPAPPQPAPPQPAAQAVASPTAPSGIADGDEVVRIKGLGPRLAEQLRALGVTSLAQIAAWDDAEIDRIDAQLGRFQGRIRRDNWPEQARLLTSGDVSAYEARFGKL